MVDIADNIARQHRRAGLLNPSDWQALRHGFMGMYWDGGHIALEEILAMQTTLLLQHVGVSPQLYSDPARRHGLGLPHALQSLCDAVPVGGD